MQVEVTHLFSTTKCIQTGHPYRLSVAQKKTRLGLTDSLNTSNGKLDTKLGTNGRYCSLHNRRVLHNDDAETNGKILESAWLQYNSLHEHSIGVSYA